MKITEKLPQFDDKTALLIVTGSQEAVFYIAQDGEIQQIESFKVEKPKYTDVEGHFETRSGGDTVKAGSPYEPTDVSDDAVRNFLKDLKDKLSAVSKQYDPTSLYLFCPAHLKNEVRDQFPYAFKDVDQDIITGNYFTSHPFDLLTKIQKKNQTNPIKPLSEAAKKILDKFKGTKE